MAFCPQCGKPLSEEGNEKFCDSCGASLQENNNVETNDVKENIGEAVNDVAEKAGQTASDVVEKVKTLDKKVLAMIAAAVVVVIIIFNMLGSKSYMEPVDDFMAAINKQEESVLTLRYALMGDKASKDMDDMVKAMLEFEESFEDSIEYENDSLADYYEDANDEYDKWKLDFEVKEAEKMDEDDFEDLKEGIEDTADYMVDSVDDYEDMLDDDDMLESMASSLDIDEKEAEDLVKSMIKYAKTYEDIDVKEAYEVKGKFIIDADGDEIKTSTVKFVVVNVNGEWVYAGSDDYISFENDDEYVFSFISNYLNSSYTTSSIF